VIEPVTQRGEIALLDGSQGIGALDRLDVLEVLVRRAPRLVDLVDFAISLLAPGRQPLAPARRPAGVLPLRQIAHVVAEVVE